MLWIILLITLTATTDPTDTTTRPPQPITAKPPDPAVPDNSDATKDKATGLTKTVSDTSSHTTGTPRLTLPATPDDICTDGKGHIVYKMSWETDLLVVHEEMVVEIRCARKELYKDISCLQNMTKVELTLNTKPGANGQFKPIAENHYNRTDLKNVTVFHFIPQYELHLVESLIRCQLGNETDFMSQEQTLYVIEKPKVKMFPERIDALVGETFNITCKCSSKAALARLWWTKEATGDGSYDGITSNGETINITTDHVDDPWSSILTVQTESVWKGNYKCAFTSVHAEKEEAIIEVHITNKSQLPLILGVSGAVLVVLVVAVVVVVKRRKKILDNMRMNLKVMSVQNETNNYGDRLLV